MRRAPRCSIPIKVHKEKKKHHNPVTSGLQYKDTKKESGVKVECGQVGKIKDSNIASWNAMLESDEIFKRNICH